MFVVQLLKHPTLKVGMNGNWKGLLNLGAKGLGLVGKKKAENHGVPYNLTEEFTAIYRMHQMLPDSLPLEGEAPVAMTELLTEKGTTPVATCPDREKWEQWRENVLYSLYIVTENYTQQIVIVL